MSKYPHHRGELVQSAGSDGWTVYEARTDSLHVLNESARAIWELCDGKTTPKEMAAAISELAGIELDEASRDVARTITTLEELGLID